MKQSKFVFLFLIFLFSPILLFSQNINNLAALQEEQGPKITISGYIDTGYDYYDWEDRDASLLKGQIGDKNQFFVNHLNLYFNFKVHKDWLAFTEIRFLYAPMGNEKVLDGTQTYTVPIDTIYLDPGLVSFPGGSIYLERAYIEWNHWEFFKIRAGQYLTPYGIWSQDHGSPILTTIRVPYVVNAGARAWGMPQSQAGAEILGTIPIGPVTLDYAAYIGNGVSWATFINDADNPNKSFGGFLNMNLALGIFSLDTGVSIYYGDVSIKDVKDDSTKQTVWKEKQTSVVACAHLKFSVENLPLDSRLIIQGEFLHQDSKRENGAIYSIPFMSFPTYLGPSPVNSTTAKDYTLTIFYAQVEYQLLGCLSPYFRFERFIITDSSYRPYFYYFYNYVAGLNYKPIPRVAIKAEFNYIDYHQTLSSVNNDVMFYAVQIALAF